MTIYVGRRTTRNIVLTLFGQIFEWRSGGQEAIAYTGNEINKITGTDKHLYKCIYNQTDDESFNLCDTSNLPIVKFNE